MNEGDLGLEHRRRLRVGGDRRWRDVGKIFLIDVSLGLLGIGGDPVAYQLVRQGAADPCDGKGEAGVLGRREVSNRHQVP